MDKLEWKPEGARWRGQHTAFSAQPDPVRKYTVEDLGDGRGRATQACVQYDGATCGCLGTFGSQEEAQAACQAHYDSVVPVRSTTSSN